MRNVKRWAIVILFAVAFAWVEAAAVTYIRVHIGRIEPYQANPLPIANTLGQIELVREVATLIMLLSVGYLSGRDRRTRLAYAILAFGVWDIFYYLFLRIQIGWPQTLMDWDILFLLPLPWWGPVIAPMVIAAILALVPLGLGLTEGALIASDLAVVVIGGLTTSTFLTLLVVPVAYSIVESALRRLRRS